MASISIPCPKISSVAAGVGSVARISKPQNQRVLFPHAVNFKSKASLLSGSTGHDSAFNGFQCLSKGHSADWKRHAQVASNSAPIADTKSNAASLEEKTESADDNIPDVAAISAFMAQVSDLVKLVDSRDIVELQLKQQDCELLIRKKEALQQPAPAPQYITMPPSTSPAMFSTPPPVAAPAIAAPSPSASTPALAPAALPAPAKGGSSHPPLKCPMAGTFYRCPGPGEPPFVKVGDKVKKGQVICIIEAMKLMNEIEADQSGTITEILVEDTKPVSVDMPLFVIAP